jgi:hypothetical protein
MRLTPGSGDGQVRNDDIPPPYTFSVQMGKKYRNSPSLVGEDLAGSARCREKFVWFVTA